MAAEALVCYRLDTLPATVPALDYRLALPEEKRLVAELERARRAVELRTASGRRSSRI